MSAAIDVRRATSRFHIRLGWLDSRHSHSFVPQDVERVVCSGDVVGRPGDLGEGGEVGGLTPDPVVTGALGPLAVASVSNTVGAAPARSWATCRPGTAPSPGRPPAAWRR